MTTNVILLHKKSPELHRFLGSLPRGDEPLAVTISPDLARSIRFTAGMHSKDPQEFVLDWLKSGFPRNGDAA
jgi:hypothetical protein